MSDMEHRLLIEGLSIANHTDYSKYRHGKSTSVGFTFRRGDKDIAIHDSRMLKGIVTMEWLLVADADKDMFTESMGYYPFKYNYNGDALESKWFDEYCLKRYSLDMFYRMKFYKVNGLDPRFRLAFVGGIASRKERKLLLAANSVAKDVYENILGNMEARDYAQWYADNQKAIKHNAVNFHYLLQKYSRRWPISRRHK